MLSADDITTYANIQANKQRQQSMESDDTSIFDVGAWAVASTVDLATSLADSLTLGYCDNALCETDKALSHIDTIFDTDVSGFYEDNQAIVNTTSLIGGIFMPMGAARLAGRMVKAARNNGAKLPNMYSKLDRARQTNRLRAARNLEYYGEQSQRYQQAISRMKWQTIGQGAAEGVMWEAGFFATMNGHAFIEDNYDGWDFAIGAGLGSMVGPVKWMMANSEFKNLATSLQQSQQEATKDTIAYIARGETKGHTLSNLSVVYQNGKQIDTTGMNQWQLDNVAGHTKVSLQKTKGLIDDMADESFAARGGAKKEEGYQKILLDMDIPDAYGATSDQMILTKMSVDNPNTFVGVNKFGHTDEAAYNADDIVNNILLDRQPGEMMAIDGATAAKVIAPEWGGGAGIEAALLARQVDTPTTIPIGVSVRHTTKNGRMVIEIEVPNAKMYKGKGKQAKEFRAWAFKYLNTGERKGAPIVLKSTDGHLAGISHEPLKREVMAARGEVDLLLDAAANGGKGKFVSPEQLDEVADLTMDTGVINKYFGYNVMPSTHARLAQTAAGDSSVLVNARANGLKSRDFDWKNMNSQNADAGWLEVGYALKNDKSLQAAKRTMDEGNLFDLQLAYQQLLENPGKKLVYKVKLKDGNHQFFDDTQTAALGKMLITKKAETARDIVKAGGSYEQAAVYVNMKVEDIENLHAANWSVDVVGDNLTSFSVYAGKEMEKFHSTAPINVVGKNRRFAELEDLKSQALLDQNIAQNTHAAIFKENVAASGVKEAQQILDATVFDNSFRVLRENIEQLLTTVDKPGRLLASADQALRRQGQAGEIVVTLGNNMVHTTNQQWTGIVGRVRPSFQKVAQNPTDALQFEQIKRALQRDTKHHIRFEKETGKFALTGQVDDSGRQVYLEYIEGGEIVATPNVNEMMQAYIPESDRMLKTINLLRRNDGKPPIKDKGVWFPYEAVEDKYIAFQVSKKDPNELFIITADSEKGLKAEIQAKRADPGITADYDVVTREEVGVWSDILDYATLNPLKQADSAMKKSGIAVQAPRPDASGIDDLMGQMQSTLWRHNRQLVKQAAPEVFQKLENADYLANQAQLSSAGKLSQRIQNKTSVAKLAYSTMLNTSLLPDNPRLLAFNDMTTISINQALNKVNEVTASIRELDPTGAYADAYQKLGEEAAAKNIPMPWPHVEDYLNAKGLNRKKDIAQNSVARVNGFAATMNLRLFELSHSILTVLSTPVILAGQLSEAKYPMRAMMDVAGEAFQQTPKYKRVIQDAKNRGYVKSMVSEATDMMANLTTKDGIFNNPKFNEAVKLFSKPSDWAEGVTREYTYYMGYTLAEKSGVTDPALLRSAAHNFTIRAMGNYTSRQRPVLFQGTLGSIIGLYQTFMVTMGQNMYRYVEGADKKAIMALMGAQAGMFGLESLPGYQPFNRLLGAHFGSENNDITSTVYEAFGSDDGNSRSMAEFMLYGAPSALFQAGLYTRGELQPRTPFRLDEGGVGMMPAGADNVVQAFNTAFDMVGNVASSIKNDGSAGDWGHAALQSFAAQSVWRPGARLAELAMGQSYDRKGEQISGPKDVIGDGWPMITRVLASRPLKEQALRNLKFNAGYYNSVDRGIKQKVSRQIRRAASRGDMIGGQEYESLLGQYLDNGGSSTGWKSIVKTSYSEASSTFAQRMAKFHKKNESYMDVFSNYE